MNFRIELSNSTKPEDKNYTIDGDKAYTADKVLVYNLFLFKLGAGIHEINLKRHFVQFGEVIYTRSLNKITSGKHKSRNFGFVHFKHPEDACRALLGGPHVVKGFRIGVKACDSWHQPNGAQVVALSDSSPTDTDTMALTADIMVLNEYCLLNIISYLNLPSQLKFARSCNRFWDIFLIHAKVEYKSVHLNSLSWLTLWETRIFFESVGPLIEKVSGIYDDIPNRSRILEFMMTHCVNLKHFTYDASNLQMRFVRQLVASFQKLETIELRQCFLSDKSLMPLHKLPNLKSLIMTDVSQCAGSSLKHFRKLTKLVLYSCPSIQPHYMVQAVRSMTNLKHLDIQRTDRIDSTVHTQLAQTCKKLKLLKICLNTNLSYNWLTDLPKLKHLEVLCVGHKPAVRNSVERLLTTIKDMPLEHLKLLGRNLLTNTSLDNITQLKTLKHLSCCHNDSVGTANLRDISQLPNLEELVLRNTEGLTNSVLLQIVRNCKNLRNLHIQRCSNITVGFVKECEYILEKRKRLLHKTAPLMKIYAYHTGIQPADVRMNDGPAPLIQWDFMTSVLLDNENYTNLDILLDIAEEDLDDSDYLEDDFEDGLYQYESGSDFDVDDLAFVLDDEFDVGFVNEEMLLGNW